MISPEEARAIAGDAYIYGFPLVDNYRSLPAYFVDQEDPEYKAPWNTIFTSARVDTPADMAIQTPNSDTPYSYVGADLRAEPLVLSVPKIEEGRYYSLQFIDLYTFNFAYVGSRTTGNGGGKYLLAGPGWQGQTPPGIEAVIRRETELAFILFRTQLFSPDDIDNVEAVQTGYTAEPLSAFLGEPAPAAPAIDFYGTYLYRMTGAALGVYGNSREEALYPAYAADATGQPLDGATRGYTRRFAPGQLPPMNAFWSVTMYTLPESLLYANPIDRYLIDSAMLPGLVKDADGGITIAIQHDPPANDRVANWLPAPPGPFQLVMRLYWPRKAALDGTWSAPPLQRVL